MLSTTKQKIMVGRLVVAVGFVRGKGSIFFFFKYALSSAAKLNVSNKNKQKKKPNFCRYEKENKGKKAKTKTKKNKKKKLNFKNKTNKAKEGKPKRANPALQDGGGKKNCSFPPTSVLDVNLWFCFWDSFFPSRIFFFFLQVTDLTQEFRLSSLLPCLDFTFFFF